MPNTKYDVRKYAITNNSLRTQKCLFEILSHLTEDEATDAQQREHTLTSIIPDRSKVPEENPHLPKPQRGYRVFEMVQVRKPVQFALCTSGLTSMMSQNVQHVWQQGSASSFFSAYTVISCKDPRQIHFPIFIFSFPVFILRFLFFRFCFSIFGFPFSVFDF